MSASTPTPLETPIVDGGIWSVNFFNGRLLSADTLSDEQTANRTARLQLGKALGSGVAYGLEATKATDVTDPLAPVVTVAKGLAVNRLGQTLELTETTDLALRREDATTTTVDSLDFSDCMPAPAGTYRTGSGLFVLAIGPSESTWGRATVSGLANSTPTCATKYSIEGVQFRLVRVLVEDHLLADDALVRNRVAYRFLGTTSSAREAFERDPFGGPVATYGIDDLWDGCLDEREIPLALVYWTAADGIAFVDRWAVRRRLAACAADASWPLLAGERAEREGEAMLLQFQEQLDDIRTTEAGIDTLKASDRFELLPPVGLLPLETSSFTAGFADDAFFAGTTTCEAVFVDGAVIDDLVCEALVYSPIDLSSHEAIRLYVVRQNERPPGPDETATRPYIVFANGHCSYRGDARLDLSYFNYANVAENYC